MVPLRFVQTRGTPARFNFNRGSGAVLLAESSGTIEVRCVQDDAWYPMAVGESVPAPLPYARRIPPEHVHWWDHRPEGAFDV
jgi:hypothetical protein